MMMFLVDDGVVDDDDDVLLLSSSLAIPKMTQFCNLSQTIGVFFIFLSCQ